MSRLLLVCSILISFSVDAMNLVCNQKALNRRARNYVEEALEGRTVRKELLIDSLQFLSEEALKVPMIAILENESIFFGLCERASAVKELSSFVNICKEVFSEVEQLKKVQVSMLLNTILSFVPCSGLSEVNCLDKLMPSSFDNLLLEPLD